MSVIGRSGDQRVRRQPLYGFSLAATGTFGVVDVVADDEVELELAAGALIHWAPIIGPGDTLGTGPEVKSILPTMVVLFSVDSALATAALSVGSPLALQRLEAGVEQASVAPSCCCHCLPVAFS